MQRELLEDEDRLASGLDVLEQDTGAAVEAAAVAPPAPTVADLDMSKAPPLPEWKYADAAEATAELNKLAAKLLKARLKGDKGQVERLEQRVSVIQKSQKLHQDAVQERERWVKAQLKGLAGARSAREPAGALFPIVGSRVIGDVDSRGRIRGVVEAVQTQRAAPVPKSKGQRARELYDQSDNQRSAYFRSDNQQNTLKDMVREERLGLGEDVDANEARWIMNAGGKYSHGNLDEQWDSMEHDMRRYENKSSRMDADRLQERQRREAVRDAQRLDKALVGCFFCPGSPKYADHLTVSSGLRLYLALPAVRRVAPFHCLISPLEHLSASIEFDDPVYEELQFWKRHLVKMFEVLNMGCVFVETFNGRSNQHTTIECIPLQQDRFVEAPMFFRKGIQEADEEWSQHKKLIDHRRPPGAAITSGKASWRDFRRSVPQKFPYFNVEFGMDGGYAHVIEDHAQFPANFGLSTICGLLEEPSEFVLRQRREPRHQEMQRVEAFRSKWLKFDWTRVLKKNAPQQQQQQ